MGGNTDELTKTMGSKELDRAGNETQVKNLRVGRAITIRGKHKEERKLLIRIQGRQERQENKSQRFAFVMSTH